MNLGGVSRGRRGRGQLENEVLTALWSLGEPAPARQVQDMVSGNPAYTTILTILSRLHDKGLITRERVGRGYAYVPVRDEAGHAAAGMRALLEGAGDRAAVLARFVSELTEEDEQAIERVLHGNAED